ncbi:GPO family capsid scaffolding protein [Providencia sp. 1709051003]|uniref:GPO family capsid scaffolding protein n=1 Tax=Providencia sp. 1709051003 TaxID=2603246 RepID=UPI0034D62CDB
MSQLRTTWLCIATEGETADGREILRDELLDIAETYDPELYTALIWEGHRTQGQKRGDPLGEVLALRAEYDDAKVLHLYAILRPYIRLLEANSQNRLLFTSIEMQLNWRGTGKTYMDGLAVTDEPASVGTTRLQFSRQDNQRTEDMSKWRKKFGIEEPQPAPQPTSIADDETLAEMAKELDAALREIESLKQQLAETKVEVSDAQDDIDKVKEVVDTEDFAKLRDNLPNIVKSFSKLDKAVTTKPNLNPNGNKNARFNFL